MKKYPSTAEILREFAIRALEECGDDRAVWIELSPSGLVLRASSGGRRYNRVVAWDQIEHTGAPATLIAFEITALMNGLEQFESLQPLQDAI